MRSLPRTNLIRRRILLVAGIFALGLLAIKVADGQQTSPPSTAPLPPEVVQVILNLARTTGSVTSRPGEVKADAANLLANQLDGLKQQLENIRIPPAECVNDFETPGCINLVSKSALWFCQWFPFSVG